MNSIAPLTPTAPLSTDDFKKLGAKTGYFRRAVHDGLEGWMVHFADGRQVAFISDFKDLQEVSEKEEIYIYPLS